MRRSRLMTVALVTVALGTLLSACAPQPAPGPVPTSSASVSAVPVPTVAPDPAYAAAAGAEGNRAYFDFVNKRLVASNGGADGRTLIDTLAAAGFDKAAMQVTPDKTSINGEADSILFSVQMGDKCLIGQRGPGNAYSSTVDAVIKSGGCLVGKTRPINW